MILTNKNEKVGDMAKIALFSVIITVCAWIHIPFFIAPFSLQNFAVFCALGILGARRGTAAVLVYVALGALGLPVFSGFSGGIGRLFGETGGFIFGFLAIAASYWLLTLLFGRGIKTRVFAFALGQIFSYIMGFLWYWRMYTDGAPSALLSIFSVLILPFLLPDAIKIFVATLITKRLEGKIN